MTDQQPAPDPKEVEWYAANVQGWLATRLEQDKSLLTLSAGGIGLLITLVSTVGIPSLEGLILFILALVAFITCLASVLYIFRRNSTHIRKVVHEGASSDPVLAVLDSVAISTFMAGVVFSAIIGITAAARSLEGKGIMASKKDTTTSGMVIVGDSVNGIYGMRPGQVDLRKSLNGIADMAPNASQSSAQSQATQASAAQQQTQEAPPPAAPSSPKK